MAGGGDPPVDPLRLVPRRCPETAAPREGRASLAASMLEQATGTGFVRQAAAVTTSEGAPTLLQMIRREALKKK